MLNNIQCSQECVFQNCPNFLDLATLEMCMDFYLLFEIRDLPILIERTQLTKKFKDFFSFNFDKLVITSCNNYCYLIRPNSLTYLLSNFYSPDYILYKLNGQPQSTLLLLLD